MRLIVFLFISSSVLFIYFSLLLYVSSELPFSPVFLHDPNEIKLVEKILIKNDESLKESHEYLRHYSKAKKIFLDNDNSRSGSNFLTIGIVTTERVLQDDDIEFGFLQQTVTSVLKETSEDNGIKTIVFNVNNPPEKHKSILSLKNSVLVKSPNTPSSKSNSYWKETDDYIYCLEEIVNHHNSEFILILEDDVLMKKGSLKTLKHYIYMLEQRKNTKDWLFIKLHYPKKWSGYGKDFGTISELLATSLFISSIIVFIISRIKFLNFISYVLLLVFFVILATTSFLVLGRQTVGKWRELFYPFHRIIDSPGCCTQAVLYNKRQVPQLLEYLKKEGYRIPIDLMIDEYKSKSGLNGYLIEPSLFDHIGFWSTFDKKKKQAIDFL